MRPLREFFGSTCPSCETDILQPAPETNRMPREEAWCPTCQHTMSLADLTAYANRKVGMLSRLFGRRKPVV